MNRTIGVILAGGTGTRMQHASTAKQLLPLGSSFVINQCAHALTRMKKIQHILCVVPKDLIKQHQACLKQDPPSCEWTIIEGGPARQDSSFNAIKWIQAHHPDTDLVAIHDAARPFVSVEVITNTLDAAQKSGAAHPAIPVQDTIIEVKNQRLAMSLNRDLLYAVQTPQCFQLPLIAQAHRNASDIEFTHATDDATLVHHMGHDVIITEGSPDNFKITYDQDYERAQAIFAKSSQS